MLKCHGQGQGGCVELFTFTQKHQDENDSSVCVLLSKYNVLC